ncbi:MAG: TlpA disulfide reductase family protein [Chloroflexota bacterium]
MTIQPEASLSRRVPFWAVIGAALVILTVALGWAILDTQHDQPYIAPDFTLTAYDGQHYHLNDLRGKVVVINFWANWCAPCRAEAPALQSIWTKLSAKDVMFIGVDQSPTQDAALAFLHEFGVTYPNGPDTGISNAYRIQGLPTTIVINREGVVTDTILAAVEPHSLESRIEVALNTGH